MNDHFFINDTQLSISEIGNLVSLTHLDLVVVKILYGWRLFSIFCIFKNKSIIITTEWNYKSIKENIDV